MAAAEYFSNASMSQNAPPYQQHAPTSHPGQAPQINTYPPPPNYHQSNNSQQNVHFASTPVQIPQRHSFNNQQRPSFSSMSSSPHSNSYQQQHMALQARPHQHYSSPLSSGSNTPHSRPQYLTPHMRPYANPNSSQYSLEHGYASDPEPHRRERKQKQRKRAVSDDKRSSESRARNRDGLLGAAGGGLIGDLIFPGLGTVGGAALGFIGGRDYGKHRKDKEEKRAIEQREWEEKYRPELHYGRGRSFDDRSRDTRPRSYERRKDDY